MKIGIIGGGSIGLLISSYFSEFHDVTVYVHRKTQKKLIKEKGITRFHHSKKDKNLSVNAELYTNIKVEDCYFVCVKQHQMERLFPYLRKIKQPIIFLQNGMGHLKFIQQLESNSFVGVVEHGAKRIDDTCIDHLGNGTIKIAPFNGSKAQLISIIQTLHQQHFPIQLEADYELLLKNKLVINAVINPLTAIFNVSNGKIITNKYIQFLARQLCHEAAKVLQLDEESAWERVVQTAQVTSTNTSSMRADILNNRKTEIEAISGYLLEQKKNLPYTSFVYHSVLALEKEGK